MSDGKPLLALLVGAGGGLAWAYLRRHDIVPRWRLPWSLGPSDRERAPGPSVEVTPRPPPPEQRTSAGCSLRLDAKGLTMDGRVVDVPCAVTRCKAAGRATLALSNDVPAAVYAELSRALSSAGVPVTVSRE